MFFSPNAAVWYWQDASSITDHGRPLRWAAGRFECSSDGRETGRRLPRSRRSRHDRSLQPPHPSPNEPRCDVNVESSSYAYLPAGTQLLLPRIYCCEIDRQGGAAPIWDATVATPRPGHRAAGTPNPAAALRSRRSRRPPYRRRPHSVAYSEILTDERTETDTQFWGRARPSSTRTASRTTVCWPTTAAVAAQGFPRMPSALRSRTRDPSVPTTDHNRVERFHRLLASERAFARSTPLKPPERRPTTTGCTTTKTTESTPVSADSPERLRVHNFTGAIANPRQEHRWKNEFRNGCD